VVGVDRDETDAREKAVHERPNRGVASKASIPQSPVDECDFCAVLSDSKDQIGPQLQLRQHEQRWPNSLHRLLNSPGEIERAIENGARAIFFARELIAGLCGRGDDTVPFRMEAFPALENRFQDVDLADTDGVQPDTRTVARALWNLAPEFSCPAVAVFSVADALIEEPGRGGENRGQVEGIKYKTHWQSFALL